MTNFQKLQKWASENALGPVLGGMFWALVVLILFLAVAEDKANWLNTFFVGFGAIGQVSIAYLLYRVTRQQLNLNVQSSERQTRISLLGPRNAIIQEFQHLLKGAILTPKEAVTFDLYPLLWKIEQHFGPEQQKEFSSFIDAYEDYVLYESENSELIADADVDGFEARRGFLQRRAIVRKGVITVTAALRAATAVSY